MTEALIADILLKAWFAYDAGVERAAVAARAAELHATPEKIPAALEQMAKDAMDRLDGLTR